MRIISDQDIHVVTAGNTQVGDPSGSDYADFAADGELTLHGTARTKREVDVTIDALTGPGSNPAEKVDRGLTFAWEFSDNLEENVIGNVDIPEDADLSEDLTILLHWSSPTTSQDCDWEVSYLLLQEDEDTTAAAQETLQSYEESSAVANGLVISSFAIDAGTQISADDHYLLLTVLRDGNDGSDNLGDSAFLIGVELQYVKKNLGEPT